VDEKIKKKKQKENQMTKETEVTVKAARVNTGAQTQVTSHSEWDTELGIFSEQQIPETTTPGQDTYTWSVQSLPPGFVY
jgi:hypothetical protein